MRIQAGLNVSLGLVAKASVTVESVVYKNLKKNFCFFLPLAMNSTNVVKITT